MDSKYLPLCEVADVIDSLHQTPHYSEQGYNMVRVTDIKQGFLNLKKALYVDSETYKQFVKNHIPQLGDIIISRVGTYGEFSFVNSNEKFCLGQNTAIITPHINSKFLFYWLISSRTKEYIQSVVTGSTQKTISLKDIKQIPVWLPSEKMQNEISDFLFTLDQKIELNKRINDNLQQQAQAIYYDMFIDNVSADWQQGTLSDIAAITMGQSPSGKSYNENGTGTIFFQGRAEFSFRFPIQRLCTTEPKRMAQKNDVLMSVRAPVGDLNVAHEDCCIGRGLSAIHSKDNHQSFVLYTMFSLYKQLNVFNGEGTVFGSINRDALNSMPIKIPPMKFIERFEDLVVPMDLTIRNNYDETVRLQTIRDTMLSKLMSGELDISKTDL